MDSNHDRCLSLLEEERVPSIPARVEVITEEEEGEESEEEREEVRPGPRCKEVDEEGSGSESPGKSTCIV